eukprot:2458545-Prymnesium_polylepis.1
MPWKTEYLHRLARLLQEVTRPSPVERRLHRLQQAAELAAVGLPVPAERGRPSVALLLEPRALDEDVGGPLRGLSGARRAGDPRERQEEHLSRLGWPVLGVKPVLRLGVGLVGLWLLPCSASGPRVSLRATACYSSLARRPAGRGLVIPASKVPRSVGGGRGSASTAPCAQLCSAWLRRVSSSASSEDGVSRSCVRVEVISIHQGSRGMRT